MLTTVASWIFDTMFGGSTATQHYEDPQHYGDRYPSEDEDSTNDDSPLCISVERTISNWFRCTICYVRCSGMGEIENHIDEEEHAAAAKKHGCDFISPDGDGYRCGCCDCTFEYRELACDHISESDHMINVNLPCISIVHICTDKFACRICNVICYTSTDVEAHVTASKHKKNVEKYGCDNIQRRKNAYRCRRCHVDLSSRRLATEHIKDENHRSAPKSSKDLSLTKNIEVPNYSPYPYITVLANEKYYCAICNLEIFDETNLKDHVDLIEHKDNFHLFLNNNILFDEKKFICRRCNCQMPSRWHVDQHINGKPHMRSGSSNANENEETTTLTRSKKKPVKSKKNPTYGITKNLLEKSLGSDCTMEKPTTKSLFGSKKGWISCKFCDCKLKGAEKYHAHLAHHFCEDYMTFDKNNETDETKNSSQSREQLSNVGTQQIVDVTDPTNDDHGEDAKSKTISPETMATPMNIKLIKKQLEFDADYIYNMNNRTTDISLGMRMCYPNDDNVHCLVCQKLVDLSPKNYVEHLRDREHVKNLESMIDDVELFQHDREQFSQLALAMEYMEENSQDCVYCHVCDLTINDSNAELRDHINDYDHTSRCQIVRWNAEFNLENLKPFNCEWYDIAKYHCVPCKFKCDTDVDFAKHLDGKSHVDGSRRKREKDGKLMFDFCRSCALLWYGYRTTWSDHCVEPKHSWLKHDGYHTSTTIPDSAKFFLLYPQDHIDGIIEYLKNVSGEQRRREATFIGDLETTVRNELPRASAHCYGSRVTGLESRDSDIDVFLDCDNMYNGESSSKERIVNCINIVVKCLNEKPECWIIERVLTDCRAPIIRMHHIDTGLSCDVSFSNGLSVENSRLIKYVNDICPICRKMIVILKQWLKLCELTGPDLITSYALCWCVIFFLQIESIVPSIATLIATKNESRIVAGWEVGVLPEVPSEKLESSLTMEELFIKFFTFYANFDYRRYVACPLLGRVVAKQDFIDPKKLPEEMGPYKSRVASSKEFFRIDSVMCIQDPFDLQHNLTKAVRKVHVNRFRNYCAQSARILSRC